MSPSTADRYGGTVVLLLGTNFLADMVVEILQGGVVVGEASIFDPRFDVQPNRAWIGLPALDDGVYDVRVTTDGGSATMAGAVTYKLHAEEHKVVSTRGKWAPTWDIGTRYLRGG